MNRTLFTNLCLIALTLALIASMAVLDAQAVAADDPSIPPAEGRLTGGNAGNFPLYPGDCMSFYPDEVLPTYPGSTAALPGDGYPLYPGDEKWERLLIGNQVKQTNRLFALVPAEDGSLYVGGCFTDPYEAGLNYIARLKNDVWQPLGSGMNEGVRAIAVSGGDLYAGGFFTQAGGVPASNIARWDGSQWHALGPGLDGGVLDLVVDGSNLYAVGPFYNAGDLTVNHVARWDGSQWHALGAGVQGGSFPYTVEMFNGQVVIGGLFYRVGYNEISNVARWDGYGWYGLDGGLDWHVFSLKTHDGSLYAAGYFSSGSGQPMSGLARWDGARWNPVSAGSPFGYDMAFAGSDIYMGVTGSTVGNGMARYDGSQWSALGSGLTSLGSEYLSLVPANVVAVAAKGTLVYAAGTFDFAGNKPANKLAIWHAVPETETIFGDEFSPGSAFYLEANYLPANQPVTVLVNTQPLSSSLQSGSEALSTDALGHVGFWLVTTPQAQPGAYRVTITAGGETAVVTVWVNPSSPVNGVFGPVTRLYLPAAVAPARQQFLPGVKR